jgi:hypothetical protein
LTISLADARRIREQRKLDDEDRFDIRISELVDGVLASVEDTSYKEREALIKILKHYAKDPQPFRSCVRDNMPRLGPGKTETFCATVKDMIRSTHQWRSDGLAASAESHQEGVGILLAMNDDDLETLMMEVTNEAA